mmetsp:Transcript_12522/g.28636  ORF Transcript_12522/g.28636 Transcript_12522/m.28636 type:complete len:1302 (-) Transcript_12522:61-3966(-)
MSSPPPSYGLSLGPLAVPDPIMGSASLAGWSQHSATDTDDVSQVTDAFSVEEKQQFDLAKKLGQRLDDLTLERDRTQRQVQVEQQQLNQLNKSQPKRPRDTKSVLQQRAKQLERDRVSRSMPLSQEKSLIRQIDGIKKSLRMHTQADQHQQTIYRKKAEMAKARELLKTLNAQVAKMEKVLSKVDLAEKLNCTPADIVMREIDCPIKLLQYVSGADGSNVRAIERKCSVDISIDKIRAKIRVQGSTSACIEAIQELKHYTCAVDMEITPNSDVFTYLLSRQSAPLNAIKESHPEVIIDVWANISRIKLRGHPTNVDAAKVAFESLAVTSQTRPLSGSREVHLVIGKTGEILRETSEKHMVIMDVTKGSSEKCTLRIIGLSPNVEEAMAEINFKLHANEQVQDHVMVDSLLREELLSNSGAAIKGFQNSVSQVISGDGEVSVATSVLLQFEKNESPRNSASKSKLVIKASRTNIERAKSLVTKKIAHLETMILVVNIDSEMIPIVIGKGGSTMRELRQEGQGALIETTPENTIKIYSTDEGTRNTIECKIYEIIARNQVGYVEIDKNTIGILLGEPGKGVRETCKELGCDINVSKDDTKVVIRGTVEKIEESSEVIKEFLAKNHVDGMSFDPEDEPVLRMGGKDSILSTVAKEYGVINNLRRERNTLQIRGEADKVKAAIKDVQTFLNGGEGNIVVKFKVPGEALGGVIGKGGSNIAKLETEFDGVRIHIAREGHVVSIRGPEENVKKCRSKMLTDIATTRVIDSIDGLSDEKFNELSNSDFMRRTSRFTNASITLSENSIRIRGISGDVRDAKASINEHLTGTYRAIIDLEGSQTERVKNASERDSSHFDRIKATAGAVIDIEAFAVVISGKKSNVKKAKHQLMEWLGFILGNELRSLKIHRALYKPMSNPEQLANIANETGACISLDRDMSCILVRSEDPARSGEALQLLEGMLVETKKRNLLVKFETADTWLLSVIVGKGGATIKKLEQDSNCRFDIIKEEVTVVISGETEDIVQSGKAAVDEIVDQARKECIFTDIPESAMSAFIGKGGSGIKKFSSDNQVKMERINKLHSGTIKITGKEENVATARDAVVAWVMEWEASNEGISVDIDERIIPVVIGKGGETIRRIQKETGCKLDINRQQSTITAREGGSDNARKEAVSKVQTIIDEEMIQIAKRTAEKEQAEKARASVRSKSTENGGSEAPAGTTMKPPVTVSAGVKDRSSEFASKPVGWAPVNDQKKNGKSKKETKHVVNKLTRNRLLSDENISCEKDESGQLVYFYASPLGFSVQLDVQFDEEN